MGQAMTAALEVNECRVFATSAGTDWWTTYRAHFTPVGRITIIRASLGGDLVSVACDNREDAEWLRDHAIANGVHKSALTVRKS